jgi:hypothetical protein
MTWGLVFFIFPKNYIFTRGKGGVCEQKKLHMYLSGGLISELSE